MDLLVKKPSKKHPDHPSRDPRRKDKEKKARRLYSKMKFENESQRRDYLKAVGGNENNLAGYPIFYPPAELKSFGGVGEGKPTEVLPCGHRWRRVRYADSTKIFECADGGVFTEAGTTIELCRRPKISQPQE